MEQIVFRYNPLVAASIAKSSKVWYWVVGPVILIAVIYAIQKSSSDETSNENSEADE